jgi:CheY-like chemotaxis protein
MAKILVAEDSPDTLEAILLVLEGAGHTVFTARDGDQALVLLGERQYDLAVLDIWMPRRSGLDVLKSLRAQVEDLPVILVSGGGPGATLEQATAIADLYRADKVIYKPFEDEDLLSAVDGLLNGKAAG